MQLVIWSLSAMQTGMFVNRPGRGGKSDFPGRDGRRGEREKEERVRCKKEKKVNKMQSKKA